MFLIAGAVVMALWNSIIPRLAESVDENYNTAGFRNITYPTALGLVVLISFLFHFPESHQIK